MSSASPIWWSRAGALPPGHRLHDESLPSDPDRRQLGRSHDSVAVPGGRPALDPPVQRLVQDAGGIGVDEPSLTVAARRTARRPTGEPPEAGNQPTEFRLRPGPAYLEHGTGRRPGPRRSDPQRRTHPADVRRPVVLAGRCPSSRSQNQARSDGLGPTRQAWEPELVTTKSRSFATAVTKSNGAATMERMLDRREIRRAADVLSRQARSWRG